MAQSNTVYVNALHDVFRSGLLAKLKPRLQTLVIVSASYAMQNKDHKHYRTFYVDHSTWARLLGTSRSNLCGYFRELERLDILRRPEKKEDQKRGRNNRYEIAGPKMLERIAASLERPKQNATGNGNLQPGPPVRVLEQVQVSEFSNSNLSEFSNSKGREVSEFSNTEVVLKAVKGKDEEKVLPFSLTQNGKVNIEHHAAD